ncbi:hypothetical protein BDV96DRAFT_567140 [Lophiotrema nucula]|uniref:Uncharacterized protein n=1 Tax=Lophiotrema nucula TaxID=690887 RepID=A0A6A5ZL79_9PLEO|nr:hypothetical protein BDV96DRAFT_567140 [Lophiotrema nucula]
MLAGSYRRPSSLVALSSTMHLTRIRLCIHPMNELGYSLYVLVGTLVCGLVLIVVCLLVGAIGRYPAEGMPMGGTNSAIISAACHVKSVESEREKRTEEDGIVNRPLKWGVTKEGSRDIAGHCSFSDREVKKPTVGFLYAGLR